MPKESAKEKIEFRIEGNLADYIEETLKTKKDVIKYFKDDLCSDDDDENFIKTLKAIDDGYIVFVGSLSDESDDHIQNALCFSEDKDIKLANKNSHFIQKEEGY